ncbi:hypothetical protein EYC84_004402 [Monilinia fructicola]|uniref:Uncharacterized protein n=1 Tax=Monilinia fructicola TaxID=38448 RepID=A0A5M9K8L1_MONFR|nr:hypothetical protein EYC84_004402 [Monilinia fructicola]
MPSVLRYRIINRQADNQVQKSTSQFVCPHTPNLDQPTGESYPVSLLFSSNPQPIKTNQPRCNSIQLNPADKLFDS